MKSHGSADELAFGNAIGRAYEAAKNQVVERIAGRIAEMTTTVPAGAGETV